MKLTINIINPLAKDLYNKTNDFDITKPGIDLYFINEDIIKAGTTKEIDLGINFNAKFFNEDGKLDVFKPTAFDLIPQNLQTTTLRLTNNVIIIGAREFEKKKSLETIKIFFDNIDFDTDWTINRGDSLLQAISPNRVRPKIQLN